MKTALVTGAAGQDGVYLARLLRSKGYRVVGSVSPTSDEAERMAPYLAGVEIVPVDMTDGQAMSKLVLQTQPDEVYNLAALSSVGDSWAQAEEVAEVNGLAVLRLLQALVNHRERRGVAPRLFQASSSEVFGIAEHEPQDERTPHSPRSPYAASKSFAHYLTANYRDSRGLFACNGILFNHESPLRAPRFVTRKITQGAAEIRLGRRDELVLGNLEVRRDWGAAEDYVQAMWLTLQQPSPSDYVIATGVARSLREFVETAFRCAGVEDPWAHVRQDSAMGRPADVPSACGDPSRAREVLGWSPTISFAELIEQMVAADIERLQQGVEESAGLLDRPLTRSV